MSFDWKNAFGAATGSLIVTGRRLSTVNIQRMLCLTGFTDTNVVRGAACAVFLLFGYNPGNLFDLPPCWQRCLHRMSRSLATYSSRLMEILRRIPFIRVPDIDWRDVRIFGGFIAVCSIGIFQSLNLYRWEFQEIEAAAFHTRIGYVATIICEIILLNVSRRRHFSPRDYFVRAFLSLMNIPGIIITFHPDIWERTSCLFIMTSLSILFRRYWDMLHVLYTFERLVDDLRVPSERLPTVAITETGYLENESNQKQADGSN